MISKVGLKRIAASMVVATAVALSAPAPFAAAQSAGAPAAQAASASPQSLDFEFFKACVETIFLKSRSEDHARCYACHGYSGEVGAGGSGSPPQFLMKLSPGSNSWTEEQSREIFQRVSKLVVPGNLTASRLLMHPLAPEAGGNTGLPLRTGGRQFESQKDPDWQNMAKWVRGEKAGGASKP